MSVASTRADMSRATFSVSLGLTLLAAGAPAAASESSTGSSENTGAWLARLGVGFGWALPSEQNDIFMLEGYTALRVLGPEPGRVALRGLGGYAGIDVLVAGRGRIRLGYCDDTCEGEQCQIVCSALEAVDAPADYAWVHVPLPVDDAGVVIRERDVVVVEVDAGSELDLADVRVRRFSEGGCS